MIIGLIGTILLLAAWFPETYRTIKSKDVGAIDIRFLIIYVVGSSLLAFYSYQINDIVFIALNLCIMLITMIEFDIILSNPHKGMGVMFPIRLTKTMNNSKNSLLK